MKVLVLGSKGQLGLSLTDQLDQTDYQVIYCSRSEIDLVDIIHTKEAIVAINPDVVINAAAYTAVDRAEGEQKLAYLINHKAVSAIAEACLDCESLLIHISTDYVFDGTSIHPYTETSAVGPNSIYGDSKLKGELSIQSSGCSYLIIRTAWVFSEYGNNFVKTMLRLGETSDELNIVGDQIGCPTYAQDIAKAIISILAQSKKKKFSSEIYHFSGYQPCTWFDFANEIFKEASRSGFLSPRSVKKISTAQYPTEAPRPAYSVLDCSKMEIDFGILPSNWIKGIKSTIIALKNVH